ncbi:MAG: hypothetical protein ACTSUE_03745 [Promethearchaeota archaeon]
MTATTKKPNEIKKMSESEARAVTASAGLPWSSQGKILWEQWKKNLTIHGQMKTEGTKVNFSRYLKTRNRKSTPKVESILSSDDDEDFFFEGTDAKTARKSPSLEDEIKQAMNAERTKSSVSPTMDTALLNLARTLNGTEEEEEKEDQEARKLSKAIASRHTSSSKVKYRRSAKAASSSRKTVADEISEKEERSDFIDMMSSGASRSNTSSTGSSLCQSNSNDTYAEEEEERWDDYDDEYEKEEDFSESVESSTFGKLASVAMEAVQNNSKHPAKMLQYLSTRSGQDIVLDKLSSCCMDAIHGDHKRCSMKSGGLKCHMAKGCDHFLGIGSEEQYKGLSQLHSQLKHASCDDAASQVLAQCAEEAFNEVADIAISAYEQNMQAEDSSFLEISPAAAKEEDISKISDKDLVSITRNYREVAATPFAAKHSASFATWGDSALKSSKADTLNKANKVVNEVMNWLNDGGGARYEGDIYLGYQCASASLISLIAQMPQNYSNAKDISRASTLVERLLNAVQTTHSTGKFSPELKNYDVTGPARSGRGKRGRFKRFSRRVFKKVAKLTTTNEVGFLKDIIKACYDNYDERLAVKRASQAGSSISDDTKNQIAREMMDDYLTNRAHSEAARIFKAVRGLALGGRHFDNFHLTIRVMAITAAALLMKKSDNYSGFDSSFVKKNLTDSGGFLPEAIESVSDDIRRYSFTRGVAKATIRGAKHTKKGATKFDTGRRKLLKIKGPKIVLTSHIPNPYLTKEDKQLEDHEREFLRRSINDALDYVDAMPNKESYRFVVVIPDQRKFRNPESRKLTTDHAYRWVMQRPAFSVGMDRTDDEENSNVRVNTRRRPAIHKVWASLPPTSAKDLSFDSEERFRFRFYPSTKRLERMDTTPPPVHSSYVDKSGKVVRLKTKRDKKHIHLSHSFDPEDEASDAMLAQLEEHVPPNVTIAFRRAFD